ncbi:VOC family protein [Aureimonas sp. SA4125]|uniref:VOC family protein n=1 Tax=Aureimonas sp. SA4125 TaxID=2826993 RepID=UPI001CC48C5A|nr:VOC family protein [Aureimonas sp. SA4125]BDA85865.1 VOC family protein [Aureimonas sp. SA4125]
MTGIRPCLWFDGKAEEAARFYVSLVPGSSLDHVHRGLMDWPGGAKGDVLMAEFTLAGRPHLALNGGPYFQFTPAVSMALACADQAEVDRLWDALSDGGSVMECGWLTDRYGLSWQIVPARLNEMMRDSDSARVERVMRAMFTMVKLDIAALEAAYAAEAAT